MVKVVRPKPFYLEGGQRAVLLLHSFTSSTRDMKQLGRFLNDKGYTCYAPIYEGHGMSPEELVKTTPDDWWESAEEGFHFLKDEGYEIAVAGVSLGGIFALNVGQEFDVRGIVAMSVPYEKETDALEGRILKFARNYKKFEGKEEAQINEEVEALKGEMSESVIPFNRHIDETMEKLGQIEAPISIMCGELDQPIYKESMGYIQDRVATDDSSTKSYPNSRHLITLDKDQEAVQEDVLSFLEGLGWQSD